MNANLESQCPVILDLLPIYVDGELSVASAELVEEHLACCEACRAELEAYRKPLLNSVDVKAYYGTSSAPRYWWHLKRIAWTGLFLLLLGAGGLATATYHAGRNVALRDARFQRAVKENLFTPVHQVKKVGPYEVTLERLLLDSARTVVFYHTEPAVQETERLELSLRDQDGRVYDALSGYGYGGREYVVELEAVDPRAKELTLQFQVTGTPASVSFIVAVDPGAVQASTREWWPGVSKKLEPVRFDLEHVVLGLTQSQVQVRAIWPLDGRIRGLGFGKMPPLGPAIGDDGKVKSASGGFFNVPPGMNLPAEHASLLDETNRRRLAPEGVAYQTDSDSGGIRASFIFEPLTEDAAELMFTLPQLYLYRFVLPEQALTVSLPEGGEEALNKVLPAAGQEVVIARATRQGRALELDYRLPGVEGGGPPRFLPEFVLVSGDGFEQPGRSTTVSGAGGTVSFIIADDGPWIIKLESIGELLPRKLDFSLRVPNALF